MHAEEKEQNRKKKKFVASESAGPSLAPPLSGSAHGMAAAAISRPLAGRGSQRLPAPGLSRGPFLIHHHAATQQRLGGLHLELTPALLPVGGGRPRPARKGDGPGTVQGAWARG
ncbi:hypothetical protein VPH35_071169 [Triticum aestivum]